PTDVATGAVEIRRQGAGECHREGPRQRGAIDDWPESERGAALSADVVGSTAAALVRVQRPFDRTPGDPRAARPRGGADANDVAPCDGPLDSIAEVPGIPVSTGAAAVRILDLRGKRDAARRATTCPGVQCPDCVGTSKRISDGKQRGSRRARDAQSDSRKE